MKQLRWAPILLWVLIICWLSFSPLNMLSVKPPIGADKLAHVFMYAILGSLIVWTTNSRSYRSKIYVFAFLFAGGTEIIQHFFVFNRTGDVFDFISNCIGLIIVLYLAKRFRKT